MNESSVVIHPGAPTTPVAGGACDEDTFRLPNLTDALAEWPALHRAVLRRDMAGLFAALATGESPDIPGRDGFTGLHFAVRGKWEAGVRVLLHLGANPHAIAMRRITPIHLAAYMGAADILRELLRRWRDEWEETRPLRGYRSPEGLVSPLYIALAEGHVECVRQLREAGCPRCGNRLVYATTSRGVGWFPISSLYIDKAREAWDSEDSAMKAAAHLCLDAISGHAGNFS